MNRRRLSAILLWVVAIGAVGAGWVALVATTSLLDQPTGQVLLFSGLALAAPALATAMLRRHPQESTGLLLASAVLASMLGVCRTTPLGVFTVIAGSCALTLPLLPLLAVVRSAALTGIGRAKVIVNRCFWASVVLGGLITARLLTTGAVPGAIWWTSDPRRGGVLVELALIGQAGLIVIAGAAAMIGFRRLPLPSTGRAVLRPIVAPTVCWWAATVSATIWTIVSGYLDPLDADIGGDPSTTFLILPAVLTAAVAAGVGWIDLVVRARSRTGSSIGGISEVSAPRQAGTVAEYLARSLADSSIRVLYPAGSTTSEGSEFVDQQGVAIEIDRDRPDRAVTVIRRGDSLVGLVEHDAANLAHPDAIEVVATVAGLMMETERLTAMAEASLDESRQLAGRLLSASDRPREVLRAQLLTGPLADLDAVVSDLMAGAPLPTVCDRLGDIAAEVRRLSHGLYPHSLLTAKPPEGDWPQSVVAPRPHATAEMTAYLAVRDDPTAVVGPSGTEHATLQIVTGRSPTPEIRDRVAALGGQIAHLEVSRPISQWRITVPETDR